MPRKKKPTKAEQLAEQTAKTQADEIARMIGYTCDLLDSLLMPNADAPAATILVVERMSAYLDRRGAVADDPMWVTKMRRTVTRYGVHRARRNGEDAFNLD